jgi:hypothetical protein
MLKVYECCRITSAKKRIQRKTAPKTKGLPEAPEVEESTPRRPEGEVGAVAPEAGHPKPNACITSTAEINSQGQGLLDEPCGELVPGNTAIPCLSKVDEETTKPVSHWREGMGITLTRMTLPTAASLVWSLLED